MLDTHHVVIKIEPKDRGFVFHCQCSTTQFELMESIDCEGDAANMQCTVTPVSRSANRVEYWAEVVELPGEQCMFWAHLKDGTKRGVWKPGTQLQSSSIPDGFFFPGRFLSLTYEKGRTIEQRSLEQNNFFAGFTEIEREDDRLMLSGYLFLPAKSYDLDTISLKIAKFREEAQQSTHLVTVLHVRETVFGYYDADLYPKYGGNVVFSFSCAVDMHSIKDQYGHFNIFIQHRSSLVSPANYRDGMRKNNFLFPLSLSVWKKALITPFYNEFFEKWRLDIYHMTKWEWMKLRMLYRKCVKTPVEKDETLWLLGEYSNTACDNGMHFYNYLCRKKDSNIRAYYVIHRNSSQRDNLERKNVLFFGSYKHFKIAAKAGVLVFSHMPEFLLPKLATIVPYKEKLAKFKTIFLQHGVIATTASVLIYQKKQRNFHRFVVSSTFEKNNICQHLGYTKEEVVVTGLARWDKLLAISEPSSDILIMPTWRNDLDNVTPSVFKQSKYYTFWNALLSNTSFLGLIRKHKIKVNFLLHIGLAKFAPYFKLAPEITPVNGENIQGLLGSCGMMVTDYSSAAFDVLLQDKPVIFCPFDYQEMMELRRGPEFINYEKDLPGPVCFTLETVIQEINKHVENGYKIDARYRDRRRKYFDHIDNHNCDRIFREICEHVGV